MAISYKARNPLQIPQNNLSRVLQNIFTDSTLGEVRKPLLIPATDLGNGDVHIFKSSYSEEFVRDAAVLLKDAVLASCSAPTFFDPQKVAEYLLADGGVWANNPTLAAIIDAQFRLGISKDDIRVVSLGTGRATQAFGTSVNRKWGLLTGWRGSKFVEFLLDIQAHSIQNYSKLLLGDEGLLRLSFQSDGELPLDDSSSINDLIARAGRDFAQNSSRIRAFLSSEAAN